MSSNKVLLVLVCSLMTGIATAAEQKNAELLASSCAACHGTNGHSVSGTPSLAGLDQLHFVEQMRQFSSGQRPSTVMIRHASGYTAEEIELMAVFFANQAR